MEMLLAIVMVVIGIALVVKGGDMFVDAASWMAKAAGIHPFIIGATIVSVATTMPEMIVSCLAAAQGKTEMAIGNAVGSVTVNTALIMALGFIFMKVIISRKGYIFQCVLLIVSSAVLYLGSDEGHLDTWACAVLIAIFALFLVLNVVKAKGEGEKSEADVDKSRTTVIKNIVIFVIGACAIVGGSQLLVNGGSSLAELLGVPERVIAVTLVSIGTSLPELVTTLTAIRKKESALSVGNIIGANVIDLSLILPMCSIVSGESLPISRMGYLIDMPVCLLVILIALVPMLIKEKAGKLQGSVLIAAYAAYLIITL